MGEIEKSRLEELAEEINREHHDFRKAFKATYRSAMRAGDLLNEAKAEVPHGGWAAWVEENCEFSMRTAQVYMRIANNREKVEELLKSAEPAHLSIDGVLKELASPKAEVIPIRMEEPAQEKRQERKLEPINIIEVEPETREPQTISLVREEEEERPERNALEMYAEEGRRRQAAREQKAAERGVGPHDPWRISRAYVMRYVVEFGDGSSRTTDRTDMLERGWKKCDCCGGYGVVRKER